MVDDHPYQKRMKQAPKPDTEGKKNEDGPPVWKYSTPITYRVPGELLPEPTIILDKSDPIIEIGEVSDNVGDYEDDGSLLPDSDNNSRAAQAMRKKAARRREHEAHAYRKVAQKSNGKIPDFWGMAKVEMSFARNNALRGMLHPRLYHSPFTNIVAAGQSAVASCNADKLTKGKDPWRPDKKNPLYKEAPMGIPMTPWDIEQLVRIIHNVYPRESTRVEAYRLLRQFCGISGCVMLAFRDKAMQAAVDLHFNDEKYAPSIPNNTRAWDEHFVPHEYSSVLTGCNEYAPSGGTGVPPPKTEHILEIDYVGQWVTLHACPGSNNQIHGIVMNHAYGIHHRSLFGYGLMRALAP
ncbi:hypothetical protein AGABI2DRAFT_116822 [Agaricus bisporus var. bisporus H97]|uniref:hypothetical protein n=1 Tax=Agaricus bisporus var. bisporus (strain H97 / ATCC MYA-4626 / FGSC 10389) TaxID=936046 RepID=UPI00029F5669|nr:hypothetical protein AGABI2DRAFT_116822 [Agaricus bisporus var. bisporus H97]EKV47997.1 hypothetical protein AGABI2DRAFT_116822 [Agaricus bisporus var. bisporus H97]